MGSYPVIHDMQQQVQQSVVHALESQCEAMNAEITAVREELAQLRQSSRSSAPAVPESFDDDQDDTVNADSSSSSKTIRIPDPEVFKGDRDDLPRWTAQMKVKLTVNASLFPDNRSRIGYMFSRLAGTAAKQLLPFLSSPGF
ncbi:hypothetical protein KEM55_003946 [Ascosphaera atra]|nr:hypothetical protein KEM55_003946 [Ascosphaera atra]